MQLSATRSLVTTWVLAGLCFMLAGCPNPSRNATAGRPALLCAIDVSDAINAAMSDEPVISDEHVQLAAAGNEVVDFVLKVDATALQSGRSLRIKLPGSVIASVYQILSLPADLNRAAYVRNTGRSAEARQIPRVLFPLPPSNGLVDLASLRRSPSVSIWVELHVAAGAAPGEYPITCDLLERPDGAPIGTVTARLTINDFSLPDSPTPRLVGQLDWTTLARLYPNVFESVTPRLLNRTDPRYAAPVALLDRYVNLARENGAIVVIPGLQPTVKWPPGSEPRIDWSDFDSVVTPWLGAPGAYWAMPSPDFLDNFDAKSRGAYWKLAAEHFREKGWLARSPIVLSNESFASPNAAQSILLCAAANQALSSDRDVKVRLPLADDQIQWALQAKPDLFSTALKARLYLLAPGAVSTTPPQPSAASAAQHWLNAVGNSSNSEFDVRALGWLAFLRDASMLNCDSPLPAAGLANPMEIAWFYPGELFGTESPLPTIQLKWLRRAQQDFEYLKLARDRGAADIATKMAKLLTRPVQLESSQQDDSLYNLLAGTADAHTWAQARQLLASRLTRTAAAPVDLAATRWFEGRQNSTVLARSVKWTWDSGADRAGGNWLTARVGLDVYNPSDDASGNNQIGWTALAAGWRGSPQPSDVAATPAYRVSRVFAEAKFNLDQISPQSREALELTYIDGFTNTPIPCRFVLPVAASERREVPLNIDASLDDWAPEDAIQLDQPLVRMVDRRSIRDQQLQRADSPASIFTAWSDDNLYIAFRLGGITATDLRSTHNFVDYQSRRAWGEDLCEILIRPVYVDNSVGPILHVVCKPGGPWVERKSGDSDGKSDSFEPLEGAGVRYASNIDPALRLWRGEIAIPWKAIVSTERGRPSLLRFNFVQHENATGQSASWAGPIDFGRDDSMMGLIHLREPSAPGIVRTPR